MSTNEQAAPAAQEAGAGGFWLAVCCPNETVAHEIAERLMSEGHEVIALIEEHDGNGNGENESAGPADNRARR